MKFIVDKTEIKQFEDGMKYIAIYNKDNKEWYEELKKFKPDILKVMYNNKTRSRACRSAHSSGTSENSVSFQMNGSEDCRARMMRGSTAG